MPKTRHAGAKVAFALTVFAAAAAIGAWRLMREPPADEPLAPEVDARAQQIQRGIESGRAPEDQAAPPAPTDSPSAPPGEK